MGLTNKFSLVYNFWDISARTMGIVLFERKFVVDYKTSVIFDNLSRDQDIVVSQKTSKTHKTGLTSTFSLAYNYRDISARPMGIVSFKRKFVLDEKTCVIF